jgi:hypothetical protein
MFMVESCLCLLELQMHSIFRFVNIAFSNFFLSFHSFEDIVVSISKRMISPFKVSRASNDAEHTVLYNKKTPRK